MVVDMTKKHEEPKVEVQEEKEPLFSISLTREEIETIKNALRTSKNFEAFASVIQGQKENKILLDLDNF